MMKKASKILAVVLCAALLLSLCACGSGEGGKSKGPVTIKVFQYKVDTIEQMQNLCDMYTEENPNVKFEVETVGGSGDYSATLQQKAAADEMPDLWALQGSTLSTWKERVVDLTNEPWVDKIVSGSATALYGDDGKLYAQPFTVEAFGILYNKALFAQAGITEVPSTITELRAACETLQNNGITPFVNGWKEGWMLGNHFFTGAFFARVDDPDPVAWTKKLGTETTVAGQEAALNRALDLLDLTVEYGMPNPLAEDYNTSLSDFATGKAAMTVQGTWTQPTLDQMNPDLDIGAIGFCIDDDPAHSVIPFGNEGGWAINNESPYIEECKAFLDWMANSEKCHKSLVEDFKFLLPFKSNVDDSVLGSVFAAFNEYGDKGATAEWCFSYLPSGSEFATVLQKYVGGEIDRAGVISEMDAMIAKERGNG